MAKTVRKSNSQLQDEDVATADTPLRIKKYPNRRLYNTATSSYIVLDDIVELVKSGTEFAVVDTKSGEDITRTILNQIIFEQETNPANFHFPLEFQKQLISMYGDSYGQMVPDYLTEALNLFATERKRVTKAFESSMGRNNRAMMEFSQSLAQQNMEMFRRSWSMFGSVYENNETQATNEPAKPNSELDEMQQQIDQLQEKLKTLK